MNFEKIKNIKTELLSNYYYTLNKLTFDYQQRNGKWVTQVRECYDRGDGAGILLYNKEKGTVILTKQFRMPTFLNDNKDGLLVEICAGMLDKDNPEACIIRETEEEVGYRLKKVKKVFEVLFFTRSYDRKNALFYWRIYRCHEGKRWWWIRK